MKHISFQLTASRRGWLFFLMKQLIWLTFQLTASRRGWPGLRFFCRTSWYFNSQPHEEADEVIRLKQITGLISTHSLTKRLTVLCCSIRIIVKISTHSLTKRLTSNHFKYNHFFLISTHSLTKRLTADKKTYYYLKLISTHSLTKRLTVLPSVPVALAIFQLTASRRGWLCTLSLLMLHRNFNSQPHEEADSGSELLQIRRTYFNSQPHEEADIGSATPEASSTIFQLTASRRGWPWKVALSVLAAHFNSQPHEEAD